MENYILKKAGFTLSEVLITLGIIGVVAALTIPNLLQNKAKEETVAKLKKEYTSLAQAVKLSEADNGPNADWDWGTLNDSVSIRASFDKCWAPYLRISKYCNTYADCGYKSNSIKYFNSNHALNVVDVNSQTAVLLSDGSLFIARNYSDTTKLIYADINGKNEPNVLGKDIFWFQIHPQKGLMPWGYNSAGAYYSSTVNDDCNKTVTTGNYCTAKIMLDGWKISDDYPWD